MAAIPTRRCKAFWTSISGTSRLEAPVGGRPLRRFSRALRVEARFLQTPLTLARSAFGEANGKDSVASLRAAISDCCRPPINPNESPIIRCVILGEPFFFRKEEWITGPQDWSCSIVQGKTYDSAVPAGEGLLDEVRLRLRAPRVQQPARGPATAAVIEAPRFGSPITLTPRLGQGSFRMLVMDAYRGRCAVTQERTLPVLEAAHIHPYSRGAGHSLRNGAVATDNFCP